MTGEPNLFRQPMKCRAAGDAKGVARSTAGEGGEREREREREAKKEHERDNNKCA